MTIAHAWKVANLVVSEKMDSVLFLTTQRDRAADGAYEVEAEAVCYGSTSRRRNSAPHPHCVCGFSGLQNQNDAMIRTLMRKAVHSDLLLESWAMLRVTLSGTVLNVSVQEAAHQRVLPGYRASKQRVEEVFVPRGCDFWHKLEQVPATGLCIAHHVVGLPLRYVIPTCNECQANRDYPLITLQDLAALGGFRRVAWHDTLLDYVDAVLGAEVYSASSFR